MKRCPDCRRDYYDDSLLYCLDDGSALLDGPATADENVTALLPEGVSTPGKTAVERETQIYKSGDFISKEFRRHNFRTTALVIGAALVFAGFGYGLFRFFEKTTTPAAQGVPNIETRRLTGDGKTDEAAISPDGKILVYTRTEGDRSSLWIKQIQTDSSVQVPTSRDLVRISELLFSPDGSFVYFRSQPSIYRVPVFGGTPEKVLEKALQIHFSLDGKKIAYGRGDQAKAEASIFVANADGSNEQKLATRSGRKFFSAGPVWSPDGKYLAVSTGDDDLLPNPDEGITLISTEDGSETELGTTKWAALTAVSWLPSSSSLIVVASDYDVVPGQLWEIVYPSGEVRRLTNNLNGYRGLSITSDGNAIVTMERYSRSAIWVSPDLDPTKAKPIMSATGDTWGFSWTPDGRIVYVSDQSGDAEVWIMNADGSEATQLTRDRIFKGFPDVSSDGRYIVYTSAGQSSGITRIDLNGGNSKSLSKVGFGQDNADISPDGKWVLYSAWVDGKQRIVRAPIDGGEATVLTNIESTEPRYSPDGSQFACFVMDEKTADWGPLAIYTADGGEPLKFLPTPTGTVAHRGPLWTPDGRGITIHIQNGEKVNLWTLPIDSGPGRQLTNFDLPYVARRDYSRDGKRIAMVRAENIRNAVMITGFR